MKSSQNNHRDQHQRQQNRTGQRKKQQARKKVRTRRRQEDRNLIFRLSKTIDPYFPDLYDKIAVIPECRKQAKSSLLELILAGVAMDLLKQGSRHAMTNERNEPKFRKNYARLFKAQLPHMDTVDEVLIVLEPRPLERLKTDRLRGLLAKKLVRRDRVFGQYYRVAIDGSHVMAVPAGHCPHGLHQTFANGRVRFFHHVVEAKLVTDTGLCLSLATE